MRFDVVAAEDVSMTTDECRLHSRYHVSPGELRGVELLVPRSALLPEGEGRVRVHGSFQLSEVMSSRQGILSPHLRTDE